MRDGAAKSDRRARVLKDEDEPPYSPSCFETHRSAPKLDAAVLARAAMLLSMRGRKA